MPPPPPLPNPSFPQGAGAPAKNQPNWWLIGCSSCLSLIVLALLVGGAIFVGVSKMIKSTDSYSMAVTAATSSPEVQEALGTPIETGMMLQSNFTTDNTNGLKTETADLTIPLKGPKASASLHFAGKKTGEQWEVNDFTVTVAGSGQKIYLGPPLNVEGAIEK